MHEIRVSAPEAGQCVIRASGELDMAATGEFHAAVRAVPAAAARWIIVDLGAVTLVDSSAIKELVDAHHTAAAHGQILIVRDPRPIVARVLRVTGVAALLGVPAADRPGTVYHGGGTRRPGTPG
ncbi:STAS domain-containing protein [Solwaraspora sp. WMMD406]|uniref:STAS domain-containing protein n=1 Tax=Solwaraspora sp. WMMD406 TaxID=3016095 RepID=UPI002417C030|nr:STAS domain-containing protein [Solwaraspora sp. WMMD406]MDG4768601.1 STAS domain-containing protein [Solwaraspora sp. WMMD406]